MGNVLSGCACSLLSTIFHLKENYVGGDKNFGPLHKQKKLKHSGLKHSFLNLMA